MTAEEAKTKACPYAKNFGASQQVAEGPGPHCVASACMAWRVKEQIGLGPNGERRSFDMDGLTRWVDDGYCGLAGAPQ